MILRHSTSRLGGQVLQLARTRCPRIRTNKPFAPNNRVVWAPNAAALNPAFGHQTHSSRSWEEYQALTPELLGEAHLPNLFDYTRPFVLHRADDLSRVTVPALPEVGDEAYSYAVKEAFVSLPPSCLGPAGVSPNMGDKDGELEGVHTLWLGRLMQINGTVANLHQHCRGVVVFMVGSGGATAKNVRYMRMLSALGYIVIAPDTMAYKPEKGLRHKKRPEVVQLRDYWSPNPLYEGATCAWPEPDEDDVDEATGRPFDYSTKVENIISCPEAWKRYYQRVYALRARELDYLVSSWDEIVGDPQRVFLMGQSEGGMVVSRYLNPDLDPKLSGRIISAWSCEFNYYAPTPGCASICYGKSPKEQPILTIIGEADMFFGKDGSVASQVQEQTNAFGTEPLCGNCYPALKEAGLTHATSITIRDACHDMSTEADNLLREILASFVFDPVAFPRRDDPWKRTVVNQGGGSSPSSSPSCGCGEDGDDVDGPPWRFECKDETDPLEFVFGGPGRSSEGPEEASRPGPNGTSIAAGGSHSRTETQRQKASVF